MRNRTMALLVLVAGLSPAHGAICGLDCWRKAAEQARINGDIRAEQTALRHALAEAESEGPRVMVALIANQLGVSLQKEHRFREALEAYGRSLKLLDNGLAANGPELARTLSNLGAVYYQLGEYNRAEESLSRAVAIWQSADAQSEPDAAAAFDSLGAVLRSEARYSEAEQLYRRAIAIREDQGAAEERELATALHNLAALQLDRAMYDQAEAAALRALEIRRRLADPRSAGVAETLNLVGLIDQARGRYAEAAQSYREALAAQSGDSMTSAETLVNLGSVCRLIGDFGSARAALQRAVDLISEVQPRHPLLAAALNNLGLLEHSRGDDRQARRLFTRAVAIWHDELGPEHPDYAAGLANLAMLDQNRHPAKARELFLQALHIDELKFGPVHPRFETDLNNLGAASFAMHDDAAAEAYFRRALDVHAQRRAPDTAEQGYTMANLATLYMREHRADDGMELWRRAVSVLRRTAPPNDPRLARVLEDYSHVMRASGSFAEAEDAEVKATGIRVRNTLRDKEPENE